MRSKLEMRTEKWDATLAFCLLQSKDCDWGPGIGGEGRKLKSYS